MFVLVAGFFALFAIGSGQIFEDYDEGSGCVVHHPPHNDELSCGSLCDEGLLQAEIVKEVFLTGFLANFDCIFNKTSITVRIGKNLFSFIFI